MRVNDLEELRNQVAALKKIKAMRVEIDSGKDRGYVSHEQMGEMSDTLDTLQVTVDTMAKDVRTTIDAFKHELIEMNTNLNLTI
ncbi:hypothetical protein ACLB2K_021994 [Fragaria x ananassa]